MQGLFSVEEKGEGGPRCRIIARGYDKFFNIGEIPWTNVRFCLYSLPPFFSLFFSFTIQIRHTPLHSSLTAASSSPPLSLPPSFLLLRSILQSSSRAFRKPCSGRRALAPLSSRTGEDNKGTRKCIIGEELNCVSHPPFSLHQPVFITRSSATIASRGMFLPTPPK